MGLLDDAIREHLELKLRHGADPSSVAELEAQALGSKQNTAPSEEQSLASAEPTQSAVSPEIVTVLEAESDDTDSDLSGQPSLSFDELPPEDAVISARARTESVGDTEALSPAGDVLEETPDFLAEVPEHDRLWFEQKPPKDFDFDK